jgi:hypothetical protein
MEMILKTTIGRSRVNAGDPTVMLVLLIRGSRKIPFLSLPTRMTGSMV